MTQSIKDKARPPTDNQRHPTANIRPPTDNITPPSSMSIINSVKVPGWPISVTSSGDKIYVGLEDNKNDTDNLDTHLFQFDRELLSKRVFVKRNCSSTSLQAYKNELYVWFAEDNLIHVYDTEGKLTRLWKHSCPCKIYNKMRVLSDKVIVPKSQNKVLVGSGV